jgi:signal transduction histidine kinase
MSIYNLSVSEPSPPDSKADSRKQAFSLPKTKWHLIYFVLALFDILAVSGSLYLNHKIMGIYTESVAENEKWNNRLVSYSKLWQIASDVNAPGNNVFDSLNVTSEETLRNENLNVFYDTLAVLREDLDHDTQTSETQNLKQELEKIELHMKEMITESDMIFALLRQDKPQGAGKRMATMDRKYAHVNSHLVKLNLEVGAISQKHFEQQVQDALFLKQFEYLFGAIVIFMVVGVTLYGNMVARRIRASEKEKEEYLATLEKNKKELEEFAVLLEGAWNQTQQSNKDLMDANKKLNEEIDHRKTIQSKNEILFTKLEAKNKELSEFTFIASHDLQEPLRKIVAFGDRLEMCLEIDDETNRHYLDRIQNAALRMSNLIDALLDLSRVTSDSSSFDLIDLNKVVEEVMEDLEIQIRETGGKFQIHPLPVIRGNRTQMQQLFQNLISNSLKFSKDNSSPEVTLKYFSKSDYHEIIIQDNGIGFDEQHAVRIFKPFERLNGKSKFEGTGIGLAICEKIAQNHRGSIKAHSQANEGTSFMITLPKDNH